jgi:hypothetical protein
MAEIPTGCGHSETSCEGAHVGIVLDGEVNRRATLAEINSAAKNPDNTLQSRESRWKVFSAVPVARHQICAQRRPTPQRSR